MAKASDGSIIPSYHFMEDLSQGPQDTFQDTNLALRMGEVIEVLYSNNPKNQSKKFTEYRVRVQQRSAGTVPTSIVYHCQLSNMFGGLADKISYTLRAEKRSGQNKSQDDFGSRVLLLCVNGETHNAMIVSGVKNSTDTTETANGEHVFSLTFNGSSFSVANDGSLSITCSGPTNADGTAKQTIGSYLRFSANGSVGIGAKGDKRTIILDSDGDTITLGEGKESFLMASTYRKKEESLHQDMETALSKAQGFASAAANTMSMATPVPAALAATVIAAGQLIDQLGQALGDLSKAISSFESSSDKYLSKKNFND